MKRRTIWFVFRPEDIHGYVPRCCKCGVYPKFLLKHFFFIGHYCYSCVQDVLYDNCRTIDEVNNPVRYFNAVGDKFRGDVGEA